MLKRILLVVLGLAVVSFFSYAADAPEVKTYETKMGKVTFPHKKHVDGGLKCTDCHHSTKEGEAVQACGACHGKEAKDKAPKLYDAIHGTGKFSCDPCHAKHVAEGKKVPVKKDCKSCHVK